MLLPENRRKEGENEAALIILKISLYFMYSMNMQYMRGSSVKLLHCQVLMHTLESKQRIVIIGCNDILSSKAAILQQWYEQ